MASDRRGRPKAALTRIGRLRASTARIANAGAGRNGGEPVRIDSGKLAEDIGTTALDLARRAKAAGMTTLGFLLESAALEAGAEAVARRWPSDAAEG